MDAGILPVKSLARAKSRLDAAFDTAQRVELARAMLEDALDLCAATPFVRWHVLSGDDVVRALARDRGIPALADIAEGDLNASLTSAISLLSDAASVTIIPVDAPLASPAEIQDIVDTGALSDVVVVPADRDGGTNGLFLSPPGLLMPRFGEASFSGYVRDAEAAGLRCSILPLDGLALDLDTIEDVEKILAGDAPGSRTVELLRRWFEERG